jgi:endoglycosylceramidase
MSLKISNQPSFHTLSGLPYILDESNRARIFHGTNFVQKSSPWYPEQLLNEDQIDQIAKLGFNTIRLGFLWNGAEPKKGEYNMTYYKIFDQIIDSLVQRDIYPFLDLHQDVVSSRYCLYDAFPAWAMDESQTPSHSFPWPLKPGDVEKGESYECLVGRGWGANYLSQACGLTFDTLYHEGSEMNKDFHDFWRFTASYFKGKPILGYELINEPWAGDIYADPALLLPGHAGQKNLLPFYDSLSASIREVDDQHLIFYEPVTWGMIFNGNVTGSGFDHVPGGEKYQDSSVFSFHYYCWWYNEDDMSRKTCDKLFGPKVFEQAVRDVRTIGGATMLTEWGQGCNFNDGETHSDINSECNQIMDQADKHLVSWTDWYFGESLTYNSFEISTAAQKLFARTYAKIVAGHPREMNFNVETKDFKLCFEPTLSTDANVDGSMNTEIFLNFAVHYPNGIDVTHSPNLQLVKIDEVNNKVTLRNRQLQSFGFSPVDGLACVAITPKL